LALLLQFDAEIGFQINNNGITVTRSTTMKSIVLTIGLILSCSLAQAGYSSKKCWDNATNTVQFNECAGKDYQRADASLKKATINLIKVLENVSPEEGREEEAKMLLDVVVRGEKTFRQATVDSCTLFSEMIGGTAMTSEVLGCQTKEIKKRTSKYNSLSKEYTEKED
jgi:uncharacterized protein YecT (DUF1311 family)